MKLAVLSDIHSNHTALESVFEYISGKYYDMYIFLGDYVTDCPYPQKTLALLREFSAGRRCVFIRGNREDYLINHRKDGGVWEYGSKTGALKYTYENLSGEELDRFAEMPISMRIEAEGCPPFVVCHGSPESSNYLFHTETPEAEEMARRLDCGLMLCGHSHIPYIFRHSGKMIVNPGALGMPVNRQNRAQFAEVTFDGEWRAEIISVEYDIEKEVAEFAESGLLEKSGLWGRGLIGTLREGVNYTVMTVREVERLSKETGLPVTDEGLWARAAKNVGVPEI